ncbi:MAG: serine/threonine protein kinase [Phycisphaerales bacterium]
MSGAIAIPLVILGILAGAVALAAIVYLFTVLFGLTWKILRNVFTFIGAELTDLLRLIGSMLSMLVFAPLVVLNIVIGRWSASRHFAGALNSEFRSMGTCLYRLFAGNPARLFGVGSALEGVEQRVPQAMAAAPGRDKPAKRVGQFDGYKIIGSLQGGGSGGKLYIAEPDDIKQAGFARNNIQNVDRVVIKVFSLKDGSSLPQIVRESRALDAAKKLGLVLEHELTPERFFYVMRYVPGDSLATMTQRLHAEAPVEGLDNMRLATALGYSADLLAALQAYHSAGLWHKDVKPDNIIIDGNDNKAHLVDFGLITPLRSAMTLTTHGTEYFRDPELVRQALRGVKVHQIDGSKFDIYAAGAVLFSMIENSFPAHGGLSQVSKRCPEALRWIVRRAMTDYDRRYTDAAEMLADLRVVAAAEDPFTLKPVDLPSVNGKSPAFDPEPVVQDAFDAAMPPRAETPPVEARRAPVPPPPAPAMPSPTVAAGVGGRPNLSIASWWSGRYTVPAAARGRGVPAAASVMPVAAPIHDARSNLVPPESRRPAADQIRDARARARQRRNGAQHRIAARRGQKKSYDNTPGAAVVFAGLLGLAVLFGLGIVGGALYKQASESGSISINAQIPEPPAIPDFSNSFKIETKVAGPYLSIGSEENEQIKHGKGRHVTKSHSHGPWSDQLAIIDAELLIMSDLSLPIESDLFKSLDSGFWLLDHQGANLSGDLIKGSSDSIDAIASLRAERGQTPIDSSELPKKIRSWLNSRNYDGVIVLGTNPNYEDKVRALLVTDRFFTRLDWEDAPDQFVTILAGNGFEP